MAKGSARHLVLRPAGLGAIFSVDVFFGAQKSANYGSNSRELGACPPAGPGHECGQESVDLIFEPGLVSVFMTATVNGT